jgi:hypothetical protein
MLARVKLKAIRDRHTSRLDEAARDELTLLDTLHSVGTKSAAGNARVSRMRTEAGSGLPYGR